MTTFNDMESYDKIQQEIYDWTLPCISRTEAEPQELIKVIEGYAIEQHQWTNYRRLSEMTPNKDTQMLYAHISFEEEEHQAKMISLIDPETTFFEHGLLQEMTAISCFANCAQIEGNQGAKEAYDYILFDHLTHLKELSEQSASFGTPPENILQGYISPEMGRPFDKQFVPTSDLFKQGLKKTSDNIYCFARLHELIANEELLHNSFQYMRSMLPSDDVKRFFNMITAVENIHTSILGSFHDPSISSLEYAMINELSEVRVHRLGMQSANNKNAKNAHEYAMNEDEQHLKWLQQAYAKEGGDPSMFNVNDSLFTMPTMSVAEYCNQIVNTQKTIMARGMGFEKAA